MCLRVCVFDRDLHFFIQNVNLTFWGVSIPDESLPLTADGMVQHMGTFMLTMH